MSGSLRIGPMGIRHNAVIDDIVTNRMYFSQIATLMSDLRSASILDFLHASYNASVRAEFDPSNSPKYNAAIVPL